MQPELSLDLETIARNARAWRARAGVPIRAVVKCDGYGWGYEPLVRALQAEVESFCVSDADELRELRRYTALPAIVLGSVETDRLEQVLRSDALPSIGDAEQLRLAAEVAHERGVPLQVRIGVRPAAAWSGMTLEELRAFAPALAANGAKVEVWTHITDWEGRREHYAQFERAVALLQEAGVHIIGTDVASTMPLAADGPHGTSARVGVGLFGATGGARVPGVGCALRVIAPIVRIEHFPAGARIGYGGTMLAMEDAIATARCGYGDGLPKGLAGSGDILSIGMQYLTVRASRSEEGASVIALLDGASNLDEFAARSGTTVHEIVTAFGNRARANRVSLGGPLEV